jgi:hypothetical protein
VETEGPQGERGREDRDAASNVVHLQRDWFGPTEELVPFGPRASQTAVVDLETPAPVRPDDFWGEGSAAIHDVLQGPEAGVMGAGAMATIEAEAGHRSTGRRRAILRPAGSELRIRARARRWSGAVRVRRPAVAPLRRRPVTVVAGGLAVAVCCAAVVGRFESGGPGPTVSASMGAAVQAVQGLGGWTADPGTARAGAVLPALDRAHAAGRPVAARGRSSRAGGTGHVRRVDAGGRHHARDASARQTGGGIATPTYAATSQGSGSVPADSTGSAATGSSGSAGSGAGGSAAPAGPEGPGAPFGPGHLS